MSQGAGFYYHVCPELQIQVCFSCFFFTGRYLKWVIRKYGLTENTFTNNNGSYGLTVWRNHMTTVLDLKIKLLPLTIQKKVKKKNLKKKENGQAWVFFPTINFSVSSKHKNWKEQLTAWNATVCWAWAEFIFFSLVESYCLFCLNF